MEISNYAALFVLVVALTPFSISDIVGGTTTESINDGRAHSDQQSDEVETGLIAGIVVLVVILLIGVAVVLWCSRCPPNGCHMNAVTPIEGELVTARPGVININISVNNGHNPDERQQSETSSIQAKY